MMVIHLVALDILKQYPAKINMVHKRRRCSYDDNFLAGVLGFVHA